MEWTELKCKGDFPQKRSAACMISVNDKIYVFGGAIWNGEKQIWSDLVSTVSVFDIKTNTWRLAKCGDTKVQFLFAGAFSIGNHIFVIAENVVPRPPRTWRCYCFDTVSEIWKELEELHGEVGSFVTPKPIVLDDKLIFSILGNKFNFDFLVVELKFVKELERFKSFWS